ncbi:MAG: hypothetical protein QM783_06450 [Phycisphaerales bacterium]
MNAEGGGMQVNRPNGVSGIGQGPHGAERSNRDGQRKQQGGSGGEQPPKKQPEVGDEVELHQPPAGAPKPVTPVARPLSPLPPPKGKPPLDLSA